MPTTTIYDSENQYNWAEKSQTILGDTTRNDVLYDNGVLKMDFFFDSNFHKSWVVDSDVDGGLYNWSERVTDYNLVTGALETIATTYDTGVTQIDRYVDDVRTSSSRRDGEANSESWSDLDLNYEAMGALTSKIVQYDDLTVQVTQYDAGQITSHAHYDSGDIRSWDRIETAYDTNGQTAEKVTYYDNGIVRVDTYADGTRTKIEQYDAGDGAGVKSWDRIETTFDGNGQAAEKVTFYDNGIVNVVTYEDGSRTKVAQYDAVDGAGVKAWESIETTYDAQGRVAEKATFYDNGVIKLQYYDGGTLREVHQYDEADVKAWDSIEVNYDAFGETRTYTTYDNGVERFAYNYGTEGPQTGRYVIDEDLSEDGSAHIWQTSGREYDENNVLLSRNVLYDTGDEFVFLHEDGALDRKMERDGNDSHSWVLRVTDYTDEGPVVTTYDTVADVPEDILPYFDAF